MTAPLFVSAATVRCCGAKKILMLALLDATEPLPRSTIEAATVKPRTIW
jgi:hypothetical protein